MPIHPFLLLLFYWSSCCCYDYIATFILLFVFSQDVYPYFLQLKYNFSQTQLIVNVLCNTPLVLNCISLRIENFFYADNIKEFVAEINAIDNNVRSFELPNKLCLLFLLLLLDIVFSLNYSTWYICLIHDGVFEQKMHFNFQSNFACNGNYKIFEAIFSTQTFYQLEIKSNLKLKIVRYNEFLLG